MHSCLARQRTGLPTMKKMEPDFSRGTRQCILPRIVLPTGCFLLATKPFSMYLLTAQTSGCFVKSCQRKCPTNHSRSFHIRLDPNNGRATLVLLVYSFTPARHRQFGVAVAIAAETPRERRDWWDRLLISSSGVIFQLISTTS